MSLRSNGTSKVFRYVRNFTGQNNIPTTVVFNDIAAESDQEKANVFNRYFHSILPGVLSVVRTLKNCLLSLLTLVTLSRRSIPNINIELVLRYWSSVLLLYTSLFTIYLVSASLSPTSLPNGACIKSNLFLCTKVQTLGELRMRGNANCGLGSIAVYPPQSPASSSRRVWHGLPTVVDSTRESIHALRCGFLCLQGTQSKRIRSRWAALIAPNIRMRTGFFFWFFFFFLVEKK